MNLPERSSERVGEIGGGALEKTVRQIKAMADGVQGMVGLEEGFAIKLDFNL